MWYHCRCHSPLLRPRQALLYTKKAVAHGPEEEEEERERHITAALRLTTFSQSLSLSHSLKMLE